MGVPVYPSDLHISTTRTADTDFPRTIYNRKKCYCFWACITFLVILLIIVCVLFAFSCISISVKDLNVLEIDSLTASNFNLVSSRFNQISADWNIKMNVKTKDKHGYYKFIKTKVSVYYNDKRIALANFTSFEVSSKNLPMHFGGEFSGSSGNTDDSIVRNIGREITAGNVTFNVVFKALVGKTFIKGWAEKEWDDYVGYCENVELFFGFADVSKAKMLNGSHKCQLYKDHHSNSNPSYCFRTYSGGMICV